MPPILPGRRQAPRHTRRPTPHLRVLCSWPLNGSDALPMVLAQHHQLLLGVFQGFLGLTPPLGRPQQPPGGCPGVSRPPPGCVGAVSYRSRSCALETHRTCRPSTTTRRDTRSPAATRPLECSTGAAYELGSFCEGDRIRVVWWRCGHTGGLFWWFCGFGMWAHAPAGSRPARPPKRVEAVRHYPDLSRRRGVAPFSSAQVGGWRTESGDMGPARHVAAVSY